MKMLIALSGAALCTALYYAICSFTLDFATWMMNSQTACILFFGVSWLVTAGKIYEDL